MELCEWDPERNQLALEATCRDGRLRLGCPNEATVSVGHNGIWLWHLCKSCAALPRFKRFKVRKEGKSDA